jgi:hypothetical protein
MNELEFDSGWNPLFVNNNGLKRSKTGYGGCQRALGLAS